MLNKIVIKEPILFFSMKDEDHLFEWLYSITCIKEIIGTPDGLELHHTDMDQKSLRELIAVMTRYGINKKPLEALCNDENKSWFKDKQMFWYQDIFG